MVTRFIPLLRPIRRAPWKLAYLHTTNTRWSGGKSDGPEVVDIDMDRECDDDEDGDNFDRGSDKLAPIDIDGYADDEEHNEVETNANKPYRLPKIPETRSGVYVFEGIKIILPQRMLRPETFRYRYSKQDFKMADDTRICAYDPVQPFPRWSVPFSAEAIRTEPMVKMTPNLTKITDDMGLNEQDAECELEADGGVADVEQNGLTILTVKCNAEQHQLGNKEKNEDNYVEKSDETVVLGGGITPIRFSADALDKESCDFLKNNEEGPCTGDRKCTLQHKLHTIDDNQAEDSQKGVSETPEDH